jgi:phenylalanyl-tRNA synthetase alpha subunit
MEPSLDTSPLARLDALEAQGLAAFQGALTPEAVEAARIEFLGQKQGRVRAEQERLKTLPASEKRAFGQRFNTVKAALESAWESARQRLERVYRPDAVDATHSFMFHQVEGLMVDRGVTMADLKTVLRLFARSYLGEDVKIRFRPSFFPFTEPSVEVDMLWHGGERWVEMGGAGMVDPNVFKAVGYDPEDVSGFAFGLGIERLCMRRHRIDDIRLLYRNDTRFLAQF